MLSIKLIELKDGMSFSKPLLTEDGLVLVDANVPIRNSDIVSIANSGIYDVYTFGKIIGKEGFVVKEERHSDIPLLKKRLLDQINILKNEHTINGGASDLIRLQHLELKLDRVVLVEECINAYAKVLTAFNGSNNKNIAFVEKLSSIVKLLITEVQEHSFSFIEVITKADFGFHIASHLVKSTIYSIYISYNLGFNERRIYKTAFGTILHDIGKLSYHKVNEREGINPTKDEMNLPVTHPVYGYRVGRQILNLPEEICQIILNHHEQLNGKGFPRRVNSFKISQGDHICFVSNFFENLVAKNGYEGYSEALDQLEIIYNDNKTIFEESVIQTLFDLRDR